MKTTITLVLLAVSTLCWGQKFSFVFLNRKADAEKITKEESSKIMEGHMANINRLASEGKLIAAGPFDGGGGMFILNTMSLDEASQWLSTDPGVQAKRWNIEILPYNPRVGSACAVKEPYEMVSYSFVRFVNKSKPSADVLKKHDDYLNQLAVGNLITEGIFGMEGNGILITKTEFTEEQLKADPAVREGVLGFTIKKLYIAKGSFCEK